MKKRLLNKELIYANTKRINRNFGKEAPKDFGEMTDGSDIFPFFTEHKLDSTQNSLVRNRTTKSVILAPFNSTLTHVSNDYVEPQILKKKEVLRFGVKVKDIDRQYEANNNWELDNGVFNEFIQKTDSDEVPHSIKDSISSLKRTEGSKAEGSMMETEEDELIESIESDQIQFDDKVYQTMEKWGFSIKYIREWLSKNMHTYGTTGMHLLQKYFEKEEP